MSSPAGITHETNARRVMRIARGLLALTATHGGPLDAVWCDGGRFKVRHTPFGRVNPITWRGAEAFITKHARKGKNETA